MTHTLGQLAKKIKMEASKVEPVYEHGDLSLYLEDGQELTLIHENKQIHEIGITRFSSVKYQFKMIKLYFEFEGSKDVSIGYLSLQGKKRVPRKEFRALLEAKFVDILPVHFSLFSG